MISPGRKKDRALGGRGRSFRGWVSLVLFPLLLPIGNAGAQYYDDRHGGMMERWGWGIGWGMGFFGGIVMLLFWALLIIALVLVIRWLAHNTKAGAAHSRPEPSRAMEILKERYARGEINKQEFEEKKKDLS